jgi:GGDEF domain-containing protein
MFLRHKEGRRVPVTVRAEALREADGSIVGAIEISSDDSAQMETSRKIEAMKRLAFLDHLTQLPNRRFLEMSLRTALAEFQVHDDPFGVLAFDVDELKTINDSYGHGCGDRALQEVGKPWPGHCAPRTSSAGGAETSSLLSSVT